MYFSGYFVKQALVVFPLHITFVRYRHPSESHLVCPPCSTSPRKAIFILLRVMSVVTSAEMETTHTGNALSAGHNKSKKPTLGSIVSLRCTNSFFPSVVTYWIDSGWCSLFG